MKIIANMENSKYLCELDYQELRKISNKLPKVGEEYELTSVFDALETLDNLSKRNLSYLGSSIDKLKETYETVANTYQKLMLLEQIKNSTENLEEKEL